MSQLDPENDSVFASNAMQEQTPQAGAGRRDRVFILRLWAESELQTGPHPKDVGTEEVNDASPRHVVWRCSLQDPHTQARRGFARLEDLMRFLRAQMGEEPDAGEEVCA